jgi:hypothetical protein
MSAKGQKATSRTACRLLVLIPMLTMASRARATKQLVPPKSLDLGKGPAMCQSALGRFESARLGRILLKVCLNFTSHLPRTSCENP